MTNRTRILYLDGFEDDRKLIGDVLDSRQAGVEIAEAENSREFEDYLQSGPWDMVLTEIDAAGFKCLEMVDRALQQLPGIPVVVITGSGSEEIAAESTLRGASGYIVKTPENISRLPETLREILERRKSFPNPPDGEDILNKLVRNSVDMLVILDEEGKERFVSDSVERVTGFTIEEVKGGDAFSFLHPGDLERVRKGFD